MSLEDKSTLFSLGTEYLEAAKILHSTPIQRISCNSVIIFLLGHATELFLKAYLINKNVEVNILKNKFGHNLSQLIHEASNKGLAINFIDYQNLSETVMGMQTKYRQNKENDFVNIDSLIVNLSNLESLVFNDVSKF